MTPVWIPDRGTFLHKCKYCMTEFHGRENKLYCSPACKSRFNNEIGAKKRKNMKDASFGILMNAKILEHILDDQDSVKMSSEDLDSHGFDMTAPSKRITLPSGQLGFQYRSYLLIPDETETEFLITKTKQS